MKIRSGWVSNSSSSSYIIQKDGLTNLQKVLIRNHYEMYKQLVNESDDTGVDFDIDKGDEWEIEETPNRIKLFTFMDNLDMSWFLKEIGVPNELISCDDF